jgi:hypothetical protein
MTTQTDIFRFKFTQEFIDQLTPFAKLYQYSDRITYKEQWDRWIENNDEMISRETNRLNEIGYTGNITDKMYKSGRYYFRNKKQHEPKQRRKYISIDQDLIEHINNHIQNCSENKPSKSYEQFCHIYSNQLQEEMNRLLQDKHLNLNKDMIRDKFKKTFKNRYFLFNKQINDKNQKNI